MILAVVGTRTFRDYALLASDLAHALRHWPTLQIVTGTYPPKKGPDGRFLQPEQGADEMAVWWCQENSVPCRVFPADWQQHGKKAGPLRNAEIILACERVLAYWNGRSKGTADAMEKARRLGKPVTVRPVVELGTGAD